MGKVKSESETRGPEEHSRLHYSRWKRSCSFRCLPTGDSRIFKWPTTVCVSRLHHQAVSCRQWVSEWGGSRGGHWSSVLEALKQQPASQWGLAKRHCILLFNIWTVARELQAKGSLIHLWSPAGSTVFAGFLLLPLPPAVCWFFYGVGRFFSKQKERRRSPHWHEVSR